MFLYFHNQLSQIIKQSCTPGRMEVVDEKQLDKKAKSIILFLQQKCKHVGLMCERELLPKCSKSTNFINFPCQTPKHGHGTRHILHQSRASLKLVLFQ